jgi:putative flippase GtrA
MRWLRTLMHPRAQPLRYGMVGALTALTYLALTLLFTNSLELPIQLAMVIAYPSSLIVHFSGQRWFVFHSPEGFALGMHHQAGRYLLVGGIQLAISLLATTFLPPLLGVDERIVYLAVTLGLTVIGYLLLRFRVFHGPPAAAAAPRS